ncbi:hypothetical protein GCM10022245_67720 [Streptomyces mayteni]
MTRGRAGGPIPSLWRVRPRGAGPPGRGPTPALVPCPALAGGRGHSRGAGPAARTRRGTAAAAKPHRYGPVARARGAYAPGREAGPGQRRAAKPDGSGAASDTGAGRWPDP